MTECIYAADAVANSRVPQPLAADCKDCATEAKVDQLAFLLPAVAGSNNFVVTRSRSGLLQNVSSTTYLMAYFCRSSLPKKAKSVDL